MAGRYGGRSLARPPAVGTAVAVLGLLALPGIARAHDIGATRFEAPVPLSLVVLGGGATVALSAGWLAVADRPLPNGIRVFARIDGRMARWIAAAVRVGFLAAVVAALVEGVLDRQVAATNLATAFLWPVWVHGIALVAVLAGSPWPVLSPWRTAYAALCRLEGGQLTLAADPPHRSAPWAALAGVVILGAVEHLTVVPRSPALSAALVAASALGMLVCGVLFGPKWMARADPFRALFGLLARVSTIHARRLDDGSVAVALRPPWRGCFDPVPNLPLVVVVVAAVYSVSFDGVSETQSYRGLLFSARALLGTGPPTTAILFVLGLAAFVVLFVLTAALAEAAGRWREDRSGGVRDYMAAVRRFAPTLLPIAAAYEVAHNYPYVVGGTTRLVARLLPGLLPPDPLAGLSIQAFWGSQVLLIALGHVVAVAAAHTVSLDRYRSSSAARAAHAPLLVSMVAYTMLSLWIVSRPVVN